MKNNLNWFILVTGVLVVCNSYGIDNVRCSRMLNDGWYKTYRWQGVGNKFPDMTNETKRNGSSKAYTDISSEGTTAGLDPKFTSNYSTFATQAVSSFGDCSMFALMERRNQRDLYLAQNFAQVRKEIAEGRGLHMETLAYMSLCEEDAQVDFNMTLQLGFEKIYSSRAQNLGSAIDELIAGSERLKHKCFNLSSI